MPVSNHCLISMVDCSLPPALATSIHSRHELRRAQHAPCGAGCAPTTTCPHLPLHWRILPGATPCTPACPTPPHDISAGPRGDGCRACSCLLFFFRRLGGRAGTSTLRRTMPQLLASLATGLAALLPITAPHALPCMYARRATAIAHTGGTCKTYLLWRRLSPTATRGALFPFISTGFGCVWDAVGATDDAVRAVGPPPPIPTARDMVPGCHRSGGVEPPDDGRGKFEHQRHTPSPSCQNARYTAPCLPRL